MQTQVNHRDEWLDCLRTTFEGLDGNKDGRISVKDMMKALASKLPQEEVGCVRLCTVNLYAGDLASFCRKFAPCLHRMSRVQQHLACIECPVFSSEGAAPMFKQMPPPLLNVSCNAHADAACFHHLVPGECCH